MIWIRAAIQSIAMRRASILLLALGLTLAPVLSASHGWSMTGAGASAHHHAITADHSMDHASPSAAEEDPGCCHLSIFCGALDLVVDAPVFFGPRATISDHSDQAFRHLDGIGLTSDPPPPRT